MTAGLIHLPAFRRCPQWLGPLRAVPRVRTARQKKQVVCQSADRNRARGLQDPACRCKSIQRQGLCDVPTRRRTVTACPARPTIMLRAAGRQHHTGGARCESATSTGRSPRSRIGPGSTCAVFAAGALREDNRNTPKFVDDRQRRPIFLCPSLPWERPLPPGAESPGCGQITQPLMRSRGSCALRRAGRRQLPADEPRRDARRCRRCAAACPDLRECADAVRRFPSGRR